MPPDKIIEAISRYLSISPDDIKPTRLRGDASARRFFRLSFPPEHRHETLILILFPPGSGREVDRYAQMGNCLRKAGIPVPEIFYANRKKEFVLVEDCGDLIWQNAIGSSSPHRLVSIYRKAIDYLILMQEKLRPEKVPECPSWEKVFDEKKLLWELNFFREHTLEGYYRAGISPSDRKAFQRFFRLICRNIPAQPRVFCHRDYHSRNLLLQNEQIRIVDFQDARLGPYTYDLVSLIQDPYADLPEETKTELKAYYFSRRSDFLGEIFREQFDRDFDIMSVQRLLKAAGTFGYMFEERGKKRYLVYLPATLRAIREILPKIAELSGFPGLLDKHIPEKFLGEKL